MSATTGWLVLVERSADETYGVAGRTLAAQLRRWLGVLLSIGLMAWAARRLQRAIAAQAAAFAAEREPRARSSRRRCGPWRADSTGTRSWA